MTEPDVVVVGGGVIGLAIAWRLARAGLAVIVLERGTAGQGASWAAAGMLAPVAEVQFTERPLLDLALHSMALYPQFVAELEADSGQTVDYDATGTLVVALDSDEARNLQRLWDFQRELGLPSEWLSGDACREHEPLLSPRVVSGIRAPQDHQVDNRKSVGALAEALRRRGGVIQEGVAVDGLLRTGDRVVGVRAGGEAYRAQWVVMAAGAWSGRLAGWPPELLPAVRPVRGQMLAVQMDARQPLTRHVIRGRRAYCVPRSDGRLLVGATSEERGFETALTLGGTYELSRGVYGLLPGAYELPLIDSWVGLRPASPDNLPILGPASVAGLIYATGHYRGGILLTPVTAWAIAGWVVDGVWPAQLDAFSAARFAS